MKPIINAIKYWTNSRIEESKAELDDKINNSKADWNQNNLEADNYVKNRTHWEEDPKEVEFLPETTIEITAENGPYVETPPVPFVVNQQYIVNWNGVQYNCTAYPTSDGGISIGNGDLFVFGSNSGDGNGEPFFYVSYNDFVGAIFTSEPGSYTISINAIDITIHQIDHKYIKDMYYDNGSVTIEALPKTTTDFSSANEVDWNQSKVGYIYEGTLFALSVGKQYKIVFDETEYISIAFYDNEFGSPAIGNGAFLHELNEDNGIPFVIGNYGTGNSYGCMIVADQNSHTISVEEIRQNLKQLDVKYLPIMKKVSATVLKASDIVESAEFIDSKYKKLIGQCTVIIDDNTPQIIEFTDRDDYSVASIISFYIETWDGGAYIEFFDSESHSIKIEQIKNVVKPECLPDDASLQSNWNETNEGSKNFIQNKPFYEKLDTLLEGMFETDQWGNASFEPSIDLQEGQTYKVTINGDEYISICEWNDTDGNCLSLINSNGEYVGCVYRWSVWFEQLVNTTCYLKVEHLELKQIDKKFIPDSIYTLKDQVNEYTYDLRVADGTLYTVLSPVHVQDFYYNTPHSGNDYHYNITGWRGTLNGKSSTEIIFPNDSSIIL